MIYDTRSKYFKQWLVSAAGGGTKNACGIAPQNVATTSSAHGNHSTPLSGFQSA